MADVKSVKIGDRITYCWVQGTWYTCTIKSQPIKNNKDKHWWKVVWEEDNKSSQVKISAEGEGKAWRFAEDGDPAVIYESGGCSHGGGAGASAAVKREDQIAKKEEPAISSEKRAEQVGGAGAARKEGESKPASSESAVKKEAVKGEGAGASGGVKGEEVQGAASGGAVKGVKAEQPGGAGKKGVAGAFGAQNLAKVEGGSARTTLLDELHQASLAGAQIPLSVLLQAWLQVCSGCKRLAEKGTLHKQLTCRVVTVNRLEAGERVRVRVIHPQDLPPRGADEPRPVRHMAPESLQKDIWSEKSDVFLAAVVGWQILSLGDVPWTLAETEASVYKKVVGGERLPRPEGCPDSVWQLLLACWGSPGQRPTFVELCERLQGEVDKCVAGERGAAGEELASQVVDSQEVPLVGVDDGDAYSLGRDAVWEEREAQAEGGGHREKGGGGSGGCESEHAAGESADKGSGQVAGKGGGGAAVEAEEVRPEGVIKRGRCGPRKENEQSEKDEGGLAVEAEEVQPEGVMKRGRGRPRKESEQSGKKVGRPRKAQARQARGGGESGDDERGREEGAGGQGSDGVRVSLVGGEEDWIAGGKRKRRSVIQAAQNLVEATESESESEQEDVVVAKKAKKVGGGGKGRRGQKGKAAESGKEARAAAKAQGAAGADGREGEEQAELASDWRVIKRAGYDHSEKEGQMRRESTKKKFEAGELDVLVQEQAERKRKAERKWSGKKDYADWKWHTWTNLDSIQIKEGDVIRLSHNKAKVFYHTLRSGDKLSTALQRLSQTAKLEGNPKITGFIKVCEKTWITIDGEEHHVMDLLGPPKEELVGVVHKVQKGPGPMWKCGAGTGKCKKASEHDND